MNNENNVRCKLLDNQNSDLTKFKEALKHFKVEYSRILTTKNKATIICCNSPDEVDKLFSNEATNELKKLGYLPTLNAKQKSKRTLILKNFDDHIEQKTIDEIKIELLNKNPGCEITDIFKFSNKKVIKITVRTNQMVKNILSHGLRLFSISLKQPNVVADVFTEINICYKCYKLEDHLTADCKENQNFKICSLCSSSEHTYRNCEKSTALKCINCNGSHSTLAMSCPARKAAVNKKRSSTQTQQRSYASVVTQSNNATKVPDRQVDINQIFKCLHYYYTAVKQSDGSPTSVETELNNILQLNNLPTVEHSIFEPNPTKTHQINNRSNPSDPNIPGNLNLSPTKVSTLTNNSSPKHSTDSTMSSATTSPSKLHNATVTTPVSSLINGVSQRSPLPPKSSASKNPTPNSANTQGTTQGTTATRPNSLSAQSSKQFPNIRSSRHSKRILSNNYNH